MYTSNLFVKTRCHIYCVIYGFVMEIKTEVSPICVLYCRHKQGSTCGSIQQLNRM